MNAPSDSYIPRRRTSPHAKWALNEVAALRGELQKVQTRIGELRQREQKLEAKIAALELVLAPLPVPVDLEVPHAVKAHTKYGARGSLNAMLIASLQSFGTAGVATPVLRDLVADRFNLHLPHWKERKDLLQHVSRRLKHLEVDGLVERIATGEAHKGGQPKLWRLAQKSLTLSDLHELANAADLSYANEGV